MKTKTVIIILIIIAAVIAVIVWQSNPVGYYKKQLKALELKELNYQKTLDSLERARKQDSVRYAKAREAFRFKIDSLTGQLEKATLKLQYHENTLLDYGNATTDERFDIFTDHITSKDSVPR